MKTGFLLLTLITMSIADFNCPPGWTFFKQNCYRWYNGPRRLSWDDAQSFCVNEASQDCSGDCNSNLVSINSQEENEFLLDYWKTSREPVAPPLGQHYWIGFKESGNSGDFKWSDGSTKTYTNWDTREPNDGGQRPYCGVMWKGPRNQFEDIGKWDDQPCSLEKPFICKFPASC